jgi:hypothetical protein
MMDKWNEDKSDQDLMFKEFKRVVLSMPGNMDTEDVIRLFMLLTAFAFVGRMRNDNIMSTKTELLDNLLITNREAWRACVEFAISMTSR